MEGAPKMPTPEAANRNKSPEAVASVENLSDWRELKEQAPNQFEKELKNKFDDVESFEEMEPVEKALALKELQEKLVSEGNQNRYVDELVAERIAFEMEATDDVTRSEFKLPLRSPLERQQESTETFNEESPDWYNEILGYTPQAGNGVKVDQQQELSPGQQRAAA